MENNNTGAFMVDFLEVLLCLDFLDMSLNGFRRESELDFQRGEISMVDIILAQ